MALDRKAALLEVIHSFVIYGDLESADPFGGGHINDTFVSRWNQAGTGVRYIHQRINHAIFTHPDEVMENFDRVTGHIRSTLAAAEPGGAVTDLSRRTLTLVPARDGKLWARDSEGGWWRTYLCVEGIHTLDLARSPEDGRFLGKSIGRFHKLLADLPPPRLHETIPEFHNMESRYRRFYDALSKDAFNRAGEVREEIAFMQANEERGGILVRALKSGAIPERICHNDTKMNNIFINDEDGTALCVGDLDTVMPGTCLFDVGDLIRTVTTRAEEDEQDLSKVVFDRSYFEALLEGYLSEAAEFLIPEEKRLLAESGRNLTQIMALRFLTDYLEGDHYYHTRRPGHNLDRCRNQIALIKSMDSQWDRTESDLRRLTDK
ncbi:mucin desulfatase [Spirochaetia bacterium]|nr:mucin desulfatase [Spirochaetia bacterium]